MTIRITARPDIFSCRVHEHTAPVGATVADCVAIAQPDPALRGMVDVAVGDWVVPPDMWARVRPHDGRQVRIGARPAGRSNESQQAGSATAMALAVAGSIVTAFAPPVGAALIAASVAMSLTTTFLLAPETHTLSEFTDEPQRGISGTRNQLGTGLPVPELFGRFRFAPPHGATPYAESVGGDNYFRALFTLSGGMVTDPEIYIGETPISQYQDVEVEFRRGWHLSETTWKGATWNPASGYPVAPAFGDMWGVAVAGTLGARTFTVGQTIVFNGLFAASDARAWDVDALAEFISLYPSDVTSDPIGTEITSVSNWIVRTTAQNADEVFIDILWTGGLYNIGKTSQNLRQMTVVFEYRFAPSGTTAFVTGEISHTAKITAAFTSSHRIKFPARGQYDVGLRRITPDQTDPQTFDDCVWQVMRTVTAESPVPIGGISYLAMRIRQSGQLVGALDSVFVECARLQRDPLNGWAWGTPWSPAAAFRTVLQHPLWGSRAMVDARSGGEPPLPDDSKLDLQRLVDWAADTNARQWAYDAYIDRETTFARMLRDIARAGRARYIDRDGQDSVAVDWVQPVARMIISPANSSGHVSSYVYPQLPHAVRLVFADRARNFRQNEDLIVYADGYSAANATREERLEPPGVTNARQALAAGRAELGDRWLRRERHEVTMGIGSIVAEEGDRVDIVHDALAVGLWWGMVGAATVSGGLVTAIDCDSDLGDNVSFDTALLCSVERGFAVQTARVRRVAGSARGLVVETPIAGFAPQAGDTMAVGTLSSHTLPCIVDTIEQQSDLAARLGLIAYAPEIYDWETRLPAWEARALEPRTVPAPVVTAIQSGSTVLRVTQSGDLLPSIRILWLPFTVPDVTVTAWIRRREASGAWVEASVVARTADSMTIGDIEENTQYDMRLVASAPGRFPSPPTLIEAHHAIGRADDPQNLRNVTITHTGGMALFTWTLPEDLDVIYGGHIEIRHTSDVAEEDWANTVRIGDVISGRLTYAWVAARPGNYMLRVFDSGGRASPGWAVVESDQAAVHGYVTVGTIQEDPAFSGAKDRMQVADGALSLAVDSIDDVDNIDDVPNIDALGTAMAEAGWYSFAAGFVFPAVKRVRLTAHIVMEVVNTSVLWDDRTEPIDAWADIDMTDGAPVTAQIWCRTTKDDPAGTPTWGEWFRVDNAEVNARGVQAKLGVVADVETFNVAITKLRLVAEEVA